MSERVTYSHRGGIATIAMDDGKVNALSSAMLAEIGEAFDRAEADGAIVVLTGRERIFSGGFDLKCEPQRFGEMVIDGARLAERVMSFPNPVVAACNGNAIAMAAFLLLSSDHRIGAEGDFRIGLNEVAIGLTIPWFGIAIARHRLTRPYFDRCTITGAMLGPEEACAAGYLDRVVAPERLADEALEAARQLAGIDRAAHAAVKMRTREEALVGLRDGIERMTDGSGREW